MMLKLITAITTNSAATNDAKSAAQQPRHGHIGLRFVALAFLLGGVMLVSGCKGGAQGSMGDGVVGETTGAAQSGDQELYGEPVLLPLTAIGDILSAPREFAGKVVAIRGEIEQECPSGCWFDLKEGRAVVRVDILPAGLAIPQRVGDTATVQGTVVYKDTRVIINGTGVMFK